MEFDLSTLQPKERASFALRALYEAAGCRKYHMGRFEEYSLYQANRSFLSSEQVITFTDLDGRLLALKPDVTLSIAKTAQPAPGETLRYYYHENVYRPSAESHTFKEIGQMGLEFLGGVGEAEVQQAVCLAAQSLGQLGTDWVLEVSHMGYLFGLLDALQVPEDARAGLLRKLGQKNAHELRAAALAAGLDEDAADTLCRVLTLCGGYADTLPRAEALCRNDAMRAAVAELQGLAGPLEQAGGAIRLDLTLAGEMEYYNGLVFQGYLKALPRPLLKGGRYDLLMQQFTPGAGAIGFAVYLDELDRLSAPLPPVQKNSTDKVMLNVALPKGRLGDKVYNLLAGIGYGCPEDYNSTRKLVVENPAAGIRYFLVKPSDVAIYVEHGGCGHRGQGHPHRGGSRRVRAAGHRPWQMPHVRGGPGRLSGRPWPTGAGSHQIRQHCKSLLRLAGAGHRHHQAERLHRAGPDPGPVGCHCGYRGDRHHPAGERPEGGHRIFAHLGPVHCQQGELPVQAR